MTTLSDDAADLALALAGTGEAFGRIFDRHRDRVYRHGLRLVDGHAEVEDLVALTFLEAWRKRDSVRLIDGSLLPWLLVTATNTASNLRRASNRHRALLARLAPADAEPDHAELYDDGIAQRALRSLSAADQRVITLCVLEGLSEKEAAAVLGVAPGTIKSRLSRAKARLSARVPLTRLEEATNV